MATPRLTDLENQIERRRVEEGGRGYLAVLTPDGRRFLSPPWTGQHDDLRRLFLDRLDEEDLRDLARIRTPARNDLPRCRSAGTVLCVLTAPAFASRSAYGDRLGDSDFWLPFAQAALQRSGHQQEPLTSGFVGTYPTLVGPTLVVKLFGHFPGWRESYESELIANRVIAGQPGIDAPRMIAAGRLFPGRPDHWPYLIFERLPGQAWRDAELTGDQRNAVAHVLGQQLRLVHSCDPGQVGHLQADWIANQRARTTDRQRRWGSLPDRLIDQVDRYLVDYRPAEVCLVHGDVTEDHVFVENGRFTGLIDWGDAMITDPFYELGALYLGAFGADRSLLGGFAAGYGWPIDDHFVRRAMQVALMHRFDMFSGIADEAERAPDLDSLAEALWRPR